MARQRRRPDFDDFGKLEEILRTQIRMQGRIIDEIADALNKIDDPSVQENLDDILATMQEAKNRMDKLRYALLEHM